MPLKWKIYYWSAIYLLLWSSFLVCYACYSFFGERHNASDVESFLIGVSIILVLTGKSATSIKGMHIYNDGALHSRFGKIIFILGFGIIVLFSLYGIRVCIFDVLIPDFFRRQSDVNYLSQNSLMDYSLFVALLCSIVLSIFDLPLLKAIRRNYENGLLTLGEDLQEI